MSPIRGFERYKTMGGGVTGLGCLYSSIGAGAKADPGGLGAQHQGE